MDVADKPTTRVAEEAHQAKIWNAFASAPWLQSTIDPRDAKGLKCDYVDRWSRYYMQRFVVGDTVAEIGCGAGRNLVGMAGRIQRGHGIDVAERQIRNATQHSIDQGLSNLTFTADVSGFLDDPPPGIDTVFTMWVLAGFSADEALVQMLRSYVTALATTNRFVFFEQVARQSHDVLDSGEFYKRVRTQSNMQDLLRSAGLQVDAFHVLDEKGHGLCYRSIYQSRLYRWWPRWLNLNRLWFAIDRRLARRKIRETFTDCVFVCSRIQ